MNTQSSLEGCAMVSWKQKCLLVIVKLQAGSAPNAAELQTVPPTALRSKATWSIIHVLKCKIQRAEQTYVPLIHTATANRR